MVEVDSGPGFFKECAPSLVAPDVVPRLAVDVRCDADGLFFRSASVGVEPFPGLPCLATFGLKVWRPLSAVFRGLARAGEAALRRLARWLATRIFIVLEGRKTLRRAIRGGVRMPAP